MARFNFKKMLGMGGCALLAIVSLPIVILAWILAFILMLPLWILSLLLGRHKGL